MPANKRNILNSLQRRSYDKLSRGEQLEPGDLEALNTINETRSRIDNFKKRINDNNRLIERIDSEIREQETTLREAGLSRYRKNKAEERKQNLERQKRSYEQSTSSLMRNIADQVQALSQSINQLALVDDEAQFEIRESDLESDTALLADLETWVSRTKETFEQFGTNIGNIKSTLRKLIEVVNTNAISLTESQLTQIRKATELLDQKDSGFDTAISGAEMLATLTNLVSLGKEIIDSNKWASKDNIILLAQMLAEAAKIMDSAYGVVHKYAESAEDKADNYWYQSIGKSVNGGISAALSGYFTFSKTRALRALRSEIDGVHSENGQVARLIFNRLLSQRNMNAFSGLVHLNNAIINLYVVIGAQLLETVSRKDEMLVKLHQSIELANQGGADNTTLVQAYEEFYNSTQTLGVDTKEADLSTLTYIQALPALIMLGLTIRQAQRPLISAFGWAGSKIKEKLGMSSYKPFSEEPLTVEQLDKLAKDIYNLNVKEWIGEGEYEVGPGEEKMLKELNDRVFKSTFNSGGGINAIRVKLFDLIGDKIGPSQLEEVVTEPVDGGTNEPIEDESQGSNPFTGAADPAPPPL